MFSLRTFIGQSRKEEVGLLWTEKVVIDDLQDAAAMHDPKRRSQIL